FYAPLSPTHGLLLLQGRDDAFARPYVYDWVNETFARPSMNITGLCRDGRVKAFDASADGQWLAVSCSGGNVYRLDMKDGAVTPIILQDDLTQLPVTHLRLSPDGRSVIYLQDEQGIIQDIETGQRQHFGPDYHLTRYANWLPSGALDGWR
ncbi:MAG: WD40 repeat domain-containing protein, partial [Chloroflexota bacterium]